MIRSAKSEINQLKKQLSEIKNSQKQSVLANEYVSKVKDLETEEAFRQAMQARIKGHFKVAMPMHL